jgi:PAS domain S-box-containing protein
MPEKPTYEELDLKNKDEKLREYKAYIDAMGDTLIVLNLESKVIKLNKTAIQLLGYTEEDIPHLSFETIFPEKEHEKHYAEMKIALDTETIRPFETLILTKDGEEIPVLISGTVFKDARNEPIGFVGVCRDITERKRAEQAFRESEERYRRLVETMNDGIGIQDENGLITYVNNKFCQMLNYKPDDFIGKPVTDFLDDHNRQILKNQTVIRREGKIKPYEIEWTCKDGRKIQTIMSPQAIFNDNGQFKGSFSVITDISTLKQTEEFLRESEERYRSLAENSMVGFWEITLEGYTTYINPAMCSMIEIEGPEALSGQTYHSFFTRKSLETIDRERIRRFEGKGSSYEVEIVGKRGGRRNVVICGASLLSAEGKIQSYVATFTDITDRKRVEKALQKAHDKLERRVKERTRELEIKTNSLEEINTAMKVLLKKREEDKTELEDNVLTNVKELIVPYFEKIKKTKLDDQQEAFLSIIESNLNEIISPFTRKMSLKYLNLTPTEIRIANLIRHGSPSKEIAELLNVSPRTVETHRKNIRRKIGLKRKKANLRSHLLSLH